MWLGLTGGARIRGIDAVAVGLATHFVASADLAGVAESIRSGDPPCRCAGVVGGTTETSDVPLRKIGGEYFADDNVNAIVGGLRGAIGDDWAAEMIGLLEKASPTSLWVTAAMINAGAQSGIDECFDRELHAAQQITATNDFLEGVRAVLVDKDRNPSFDPPPPSTTSTRRWSRGSWVREPKPLRSDLEPSGQDDCRRGCRRRVSGSSTTRRCRSDVVVGRERIGVDAGASGHVNEPAASLPDIPLMLSRHAEDWW